MNTIAVFSFAAVFVGIGGIFPQIVAMAKARSSAGQSALAWCLGVVLNALLGYVNVVGSHSALLALGNAVCLLLCLTAFVQVLLYRSPPAPTDAPTTHPAVAVSTLLDAPGATLAEVHTTELEALQDIVVSARDARRYRETVAAAA